MAEPVRCPACGASNAPGSAWCGQCLTRFDAVPAARAEPPSVWEERASPVERPRLEAVPDRGVRKEGGALVWTCPSCENVNAIDASLCAVCATPMSAVFGVRPGAPEVRRTGAGVTTWSALLPGAGHLYAGRIPDGIARVVLFVWTFGIGILLLTRHPSRGAAIMRGLGVLYVVVSLCVYGIAMIEAQRLARGEVAPLVPSRALLWGSAALTLVLFLGLAAATQTR